MTSLGPLYHWSPRDRIGSIRRQGLTPGKRNLNGPIWHGLSGGDEGLGEYRQDSISFATDPATAWNYSHGTWRSEGTFDLWQVYLEDTDDVEVRTIRGNRIIEVRVRNRIPRRRLIMIGERSSSAHVRSNS